MRKKKGVRGMNRVTFPIEKEHACDVLVVGGGVSGISAAVNAARQGAKVILCEADGCLGGTATAGLVGPFMTCYDQKGEKQIIKGFFDEFIRRMAENDGAILPETCPGGDSKSGYREKGHIGVTPFSAEVLKKTAEDICREAGVQVLYHARLIDCETAEDRIKAAYFATVSGVEKFTAKVFIDTTGSATLAYRAGDDVFRGDEEGFVQHSSLFFRITGVDKEGLDAYCAEHHDMRRRFFMDEIEKAQKCGEFPCSTPKLRIYETTDGIWTVNMTQYDDPFSELDSEELTHAEMELRGQIPGIIAFMKKYIPYLKDIKLLDTANTLGVRESRRVKGKTFYTIEDIKNRNYKDEQIAVCSNSVDIHRVGGSEYLPYVSEENYYIPLSCLMSARLRNLLFAGKNVCADRDAFAAIRVMPPCFAMGEAVGITAGLALKSDGDTYAVSVKDVQQEIIRHGGYLEL